MNQFDLLDMAHKAGLVYFEGGSESADDHLFSLWSYASPEKIKAFADLVIAAERESKGDS